MVRVVGGPTRLLQVITSLDVGGAQMALLRTANALSDRGYTSVVVSLTDPDPVMARRFSTNGLDVRSLGMSRGRARVTSLPRLARVIRDVRPDVVQTWLYHADLLGLLAARLVGDMPVVWNIRAANMAMEHYPWSSRLVRGLCAHLSSWPAAVVVNSAAGRNHPEQLGYTPRQWALIPNGLAASAQMSDDERERVRRGLGVAADHVVVGLVARLDPMKDHRTFFEAAGHALDACPTLTFVLAGEGVDGDNPELRRLAGDLLEHPRLRLLGRRDDIPQVLDAVDILTSTSIGEGLPNVVLEAMAAGRPCVVTDVGDSSQLVGDTGLVVPPRDPAALAGAWLALAAESPQARRERGENARRRVLVRFSIDALASSYDTLYRSLLVH